MPAWDALVQEFGHVADSAKGDWLKDRMVQELNAISALRGDRNILLYGSAWLQKPTVPGFFTQITHDDINGFMASLHGMDWARGLTLILHTPGGVTNAAESIVSYLHSKFADVETIVPVFAMSAGTMISLGTDHIVMGRQSQLGPIDPQIHFGNRFVSARAIVDQFSRAHTEIAAEPKLAHVWAPMLQTLGPALLTESENALEYGERMVAAWLARKMFSAEQDPAARGAVVAKYFNDAGQHKSHGRRIGRDEVRAQGVKVFDLEDDQSLQEAVLTAYHVMTILFDSTPSSKIMVTNSGKLWVKNTATT